jgi:methionine salvage enolase-phosphatase E1
MSLPAKYEQQKQELDYFRMLAATAAKGGTSNSIETLMNIMLTAKDLGISPMKAINGGFYIVNGKIAMSTALMADRIRKQGHSLKIPEWTNQKCVILGVRKDNGDSVKFEFTIEDAQTAGLTSSPTWKKFPKQMLYNRAMSTIARTLFPDVVGNAYSEDEKYDILNIPPEDRPMLDEGEAEIITREVEFSRQDFINEDQVKEINLLLEQMPGSKDKLLAWVKLNKIEEIPSHLYETVVDTLREKMKKGV